MKHLVSMKLFLRFFRNFLSPDDILYTLPVSEKRHYFPAESDLDTVILRSAPVLNELGIHNEGKKMWSKAEEEFNSALSIVYIAEKCGAELRLLYLARQYDRSVEILLLQGKVQLASTTTFQVFR